MAHFEFVGKDHIKRGCDCPLEECSLDCSLRRKLLNKPTNADRIRSMSDEELVKMMEDHGCCPIGACPHSEVGAYITRQDCEMCWLEWLKSPAEVDK